MNWKGIIALFTGLLLLSLPHYCGKAEQVVVERDTITDTIKVVRPVVRDSVILRYEKVVLPVVRDSVMVRDSVIVDSVKVHLPITQKCYRDSTYTAWVSGYRPRLDSISITYKEVSFHNLVNNSSKGSKRLYLGIQVGYGITPRGMQPYLGLGVSYKFGF